jgi:hypothetical protein
MSGVKIQSASEGLDKVALPSRENPERSRGFEGEGLSQQQIKWIPLVVPLAALTMALCAVVVLSVA